MKQPLSEYCCQAAVTPMQLDVFLHNDEVLAENELCKALYAGETGKARDWRDKLAERNPEHGKLGPARAVLELLDTAHPLDSTAALAYLDKLEQDWAPATGALLGNRAKTLLNPCWRATGQALEGMDFDPDNPGYHASRAYLECGDWQAVMHTVRNETEFKNHPVLLERLAEALWQNGEAIRAIEYWFALCWLAPQYFEQLIKSERFPDSALQRYWDQAQDTETAPRVSADWYPAWLLIHKPEWARLTRNNRTQTGPGKAFNLVRTLVLENGEQVALRQALRELHPGLFQCFLQSRY